MSRILCRICGAIAHILHFQRKPFHSDLLPPPVPGPEHTYIAMLTQTNSDRTMQWCNETEALRELRGYKCRAVKQHKDNGAAAVAVRKGPHNTVSRAQSHRSSEYTVIHDMTANSTFAGFSRATRSVLMAVKYSQRSAWGKTASEHVYAQKRSSI